MENSKKRGRKPKHFITSDNKPIEGLAYDKKSNRWRIIEGNRFFRAADEKEAIEKFRKLTDQTEPDAWVEQTDRGGVRFHSWKQMWQHVAKEIQTRPLWVSEQTGIEWIGYGKTLKAPQPLPTFKELEDVWQTFYSKSKEQKRKVVAAWKDFVKTSGAAGLEDISPEVCIAYRDNVYARNVSPKMQKNLFSRIRRLLTFAKSRAIAIKELSEIIENLKLLVPNDSATSLDPKPIELDDWKKLLEKADGEDAAMILLMLNGAFYVQEVIRLKWSEIKDNSLITHRLKEGKVVRACYLWQETIDALAKIKRKGEFIFYSYQGKPLGIKGAEKRFRELRDDAKVEVTSSQLRDGAATAAASANVNEQLLNLMLGHRTGMMGHRNSGILALYYHVYDDTAVEAIQSIQYPTTTPTVR